MASVDQKHLSKKPYEPPLLTVYGSVERLTQTVHIKRGIDGGKRPFSGTGIA